MSFAGTGLRKPSNKLPARPAGGVKVLAGMNSTQKGKPMPISHFVLWILVPVCFVFSSCATTSVVLAPQVFGKVTDATSDQPIAGAGVYYKEYPNQKTTTSKDGSFVLREVREQEKAPPLVLVDQPEARGTVVIEADGYISSEFATDSNLNLKDEGPELGSSIVIHMKRR